MNMYGMRKCEYKAVIDKMLKNEAEQRLMPSKLLGTC